MVLAKVALARGQERGCVEEREEREEREVSHPPPLLSRALHQLSPPPPHILPPLSLQKDWGEGADRETEGEGGGCSEDACMAVDDACMAVDGGAGAGAVSGRGTGEGGRGDVGGVGAGDALSLAIYVVRPHPTAVPHSVLSPYAHTHKHARTHTHTHTRTHTARQGRQLLVL